MGDRMARIPRPEHPRPSLYRRPWLCLNGTWKFAVDLDGTGEARGWAREPELDLEILVPFPPESRLSGLGLTDFMPVVWYSRSFRLPKAMAGKRILLHFGAVDYEARVWLNGHYLGEHRGGYTPFTFEITGKVSGGHNWLVLQARDDNRSGLQPSGKQSARRESYGCMYSRVTGIWQTVWLEAVGPAFIETVSVGTAKQGCRTWVVAKLSGSPEGVVEAFVYKDGAMVACGGSPASSEVRIPLDLGTPKLWSPDDPNLYDLELVVRSGGRVLDRVRSYFGIRSVEIQGDRFLLNGKRIFQRLVLDQGYYPGGIYTAPSDGDLRRDIEISKEMGFNGARLHQKVFEPRFLYWADRLGYMVWGEFPSWGIDPSRPQACENFISEWVEVLRRDIKHPCIIGWCPFNETDPNQDSWVVRTVYGITKMVDPERPVIDTSGYTHVATDVYDCHDYDQNPQTFRARHLSILERGEPYRNRPGRDAPYSGQPVMVSEFGGTWWNPGQTGTKAWGYGERPKSEAEFLERYEALTGALLANPKIVGFCYTQLYDVEQEVNGLLTYDRKPKFDPARIRAINTRRAAYEER